MYSELTGTKEKIFDVAIELTALNGFERMSMRDVAKKAGIKAASIYHYYDNKQKILDNMYDYYEEHVHFSRKPEDEIKELLNTCTPLEFVRAIHHDFEGEGHENFVRMVLITKIVFMRMFSDVRAGGIFLDLMTSNSVEYTKKLLSYGIETGRIEPMDVDTFSLCLNWQMNLLGMLSLSTAPQQPVVHLPEEEKIRQLFANMLKFKPIKD